MLIASNLLGALSSVLGSSLLCGSITSSVFLSSWHPCFGADAEFDCSGLDKICPIRHSKAPVSSLAAEINVQGEFVTLATLREMLQMQERMFKSFFDSIVTNVNTRRDSLTHLVAELKTRIASSLKETVDLKNSLEFSQKDIDDLKP